MSFDRLITIIVKFVGESDEMRDWFEEQDDFIDIMYEILQQILDPCSLFNQITQIEDIDVSPLSVITSLPLVYYS